MFGQFLRLLNILKQVMQSSGVDLSQASISVQIELGKRGNSSAATTSLFPKVWRNDDLRSSIWDNQSYSCFFSTLSTSQLNSGWRRRVKSAMCNENTSQNRGFRTSPEETEEVQSPSMTFQPDKYVHCFLQFAPIFKFIEELILLIITLVDNKFYTLLWPKQRSLY